MLAYAWWIVPLWAACGVGGWFWGELGGLNPGWGRLAIAPIAGPFLAQATRDAFRRGAAMNAYREANAWTCPKCGERVYDGNLFCRNVWEYSPGIRGKCYTRKPGHDFGDATG